MKLTLSGGVSSRDGVAFANDPAAAGAIEVLGIAPVGSPVVVNPFTLRDDDGANHVDACFGRGTGLLDLQAVSVDSDFFLTPANVPNGAGTVAVIDVR